MPLFFVILALAVGSYWLGARRMSAQIAAKVGAAQLQRPPCCYQGDRIFSLPQARWGVVECLAQASSGGCRYGVRFPNGNAVVLHEHEIVR